MVLTVLKFGHPVLRRPGARIQEVTSEIRQLAADMIETMHAAKGIGLAAQQVGYALQLAVFDLRDVTDRPSTLSIGDQLAKLEDHMPMTLINPEVKLLGQPATGAEGCLSFPEIFADVARADAVEVKALDEQGRPQHFHCGGLLARAVLHELDHLRGILFIDRMTAHDKQELKPKLDALQAATKAELARQKDYAGLVA